MLKKKWFIILFHAFAKVTGLLPVLLLFKPRVRLQGNAKRHLPKNCIVVSNHRSLLDFVLYLLVFPAFRSMLIQYAVFGPIRKWMIDPYYEQHPDEDIEKRRELGLIDDDEDEAVFADTGSQNDEL